MRFSRYGVSKKPRSTEVSPRRVAAARKAIDKQRAGWGMFADQMEYDTPEERISKIDAAGEVWAAEMRREHTERWLEARAIVYSLPEDERRVILDEWNNHRWLPGDPVYLLDMLRKRVPERMEEYDQEGVYQLSTSC